MLATAEPIPVARAHRRIDGLPYVVLRLKQQQFAISCTCVRQMMLVPEVVAIPQGPPGFRGVVNIRGEVLPLIDLRVRLGMTSAVQETQDTIRMLQEREQDHKNWLTELLNSVKENRSFTLARDPHQCKFGKWYDHYKPENHALAFLLARFDRPHRAIHAIADKVGEHALQGEYEKAHALIEATKNGELAEMIRLFEEMRQAFRDATREVAVILRRSGRQIAISADEVVAIESLDSKTVEPLSGIAHTIDTTLTPQLARRRGSDTIVLLLDCDQLFGCAQASAITTHS